MITKAVLAECRSKRNVTAGYLKCLKAQRELRLHKNVFDYGICSAKKDERARLKTMALSRA